MFSYLNSSSSGVPTVDVAAQRVNAIATLTAAVPGINVAHGTKRRSKKNVIVSKSYNTVASRPIAMKNNPEQIYRANMRGESIGFHTTSTVANTYGSFYFIMTNLSGYAEYLGLFDQYMFEEIEVWIEPQQSQSTAMSNQGILATAVDLDDAGTPTGFAAVEDKQNSLVTGGLDGHYHKWKPHMALGAYSAGVFSAFANVPAGWIDSGSNSVQHYGIKIAATSTSAVITYNLHFRVRLAFKQAGI